MEHHAHAHPKAPAWLDSLAIGMAGLCAIHCLLTPVLIVLLPVLATSFFLHQDFHLWMLLLVIPTTSLAVFMGCRRHRDWLVVALSVIGLSLLIAALAHERIAHAAASEDGHVHGPSCVHSVVENPVNAWAWINTLGGVFLAGAHVRNYRLCRKSACSHEA